MAQDRPSKADRSVAVGTTYRSLGVDRAVPPPGEEGEVGLSPRWGLPGSGDLPRPTPWLIALAVLPWAIMLIGTPIVIVVVGASGQIPAAVQVPVMATIFLALIARLVVTAVRVPGRRFSTGSLALALVLWAAGSAQVSSAPSAGATVQFPAPGEWLFVLSFLALAAFLFLDVAPRVRPSLADWLDATIASSGAISLVALAVLTPFADEFARHGVPLIVALIYPAMDVVLIAVVVGQVNLRRRAPSIETGILALGLVALTVADVSGSFVYIEAGNYGYSVLADFSWCMGYLLITDAACRRHSEPGPSSLQALAGGGVTVAAAAVALGALAFQPAGVGRPYVVVPAVITCVAAGVRLLITLRQARSAAEAYRLSRTDELTGLPNRRAITTDLAAKLATEEPVSVVLLDLDGFKEVNDSLGHASGDSLLKIVARRLRHALPEDVMAARLSSDEFALVLSESGPEALIEFADEMRRLIRRPIHLDGLEISVEASAGVAVRTAEIATKGDLLRCADVALHQAKVSGTGTVVYDPEQDEYSRSRLALAEELRHGLERNELVVWYQPQVESKSGRVCSVEALVRWKHPRQGLLAPFAFLQAARRAGLMPRLTEVVLTQAVRDLAGWRNRGIDVSVAVNVAPPELLGGTVLPELGRVLAEAGVPADRLIVEVTEDSFLAEPEHARRVIQQLRSQGIQVSIDDYGTGYSSLAYLRDLPLQELKIDRSFVMNILSDKRSWMIVNTTNQLAHGLGLRTVAEGVEDADQQRELAAIGIDVLQGFHFARPMPAEHLVSWLTSHVVDQLPRQTA
jgi:diguanylate cyclase (GGDEF)-like protein